jgi:hypothetical protein
VPNWRWQRATKRTLIFAVACVASVTILAVGAASSVIVSSLGGRLYADPLAGFEPAVDGVRALGRPNTEGGQQAAAAPTTVTPTLAVYASRGDSPSSVDFVPRWKPLPADTATLDLHAAVADPQCKHQDRCCSGAARPKHRQWTSS